MTTCINLQKYQMEYFLVNEWELIIKIVDAIKKNEDIILRTDEGKHFGASGLYDLLDMICEYYNYPKNKFTLENNNWTEWHPHYNIKRSPFNSDLSTFSKENEYIVPYTGDKFYGLFIGRADKNRIRSIVLSKRLNIPCMSSFNTELPNLSNHIMVDVAKALLETDITENELKSIKPFSDVHEVIVPPIIAPQNSLGTSWASVYQNIAIEIVNETTLFPDSFHVTEKTFRPMYFKRPFIMIGAKNFLKNLRSIGFKTFNNILPKHDTIEDDPDKAFAILADLYKTCSPQDILSLCADDLENNYNNLLELGRKNKKILNEVGGFSYYDK